MKKAKPVFSIKVRRRGKDGWAVGPYETDDKKSADEWLTKLVGQHQGEGAGSHQVVLKLNGGYSVDPERGITAVINFKAPLDEIWGIWNGYAAERTWF